MDFQDLPAPERLLRIYLCHSPAEPMVAGSVSSRRKRPPEGLGPGVEQVELVLEGRGIITLGEEREEVSPGALVWEVAGDGVIASVDPKEPCLKLVVVFEARCSPGMRRAAPLVWWREPEALAAFSREITEAWRAEGPDTDALCAWVYGRLLYESRRWHRKAWFEGLPPQLKDVLQWIETRFAQSLSVEEMADQVGWSAPHLHEVFRKWLGTTPYQLILERRLRFARHQLATSDEPIHAIAIRSGFANAPAFCHVFKSRTGQTPLRYRKEQQAD